MITETALKRLCKPVVLRRARRIVDSGNFINKRKCRFDEGETVLRARVDSHASWEEAHRTSVVLDEASDAVVYFECDCHAARVSDAPCDHAIAVILDYNKHPEVYDGYATRDRPLTSRGMRRLMDQFLDVPQMATPTIPTELGMGTVRLEATLAYEVGFDVRFRLVGSKGAYALKSIGEFVARVEAREFAEYGKKLAFEHVPETFAQQSRGVVVFLVRAVQNRRAFALERVAGRHVVSGNAVPMRELHLSAPELWELLGLYRSEGMLFEDRSQGATAEAPHAVRIVDGDPKVHIDIESLPDGGGFEVMRNASVRVVTAGGRALAWSRDTLYVCSRELSQSAEILSSLMAHPDERMVLSDADAPMFCASVLRRLESCASVKVPERLDLMRPHPCKVSFRLDFDGARSVVTCDARVSYGDASFALFASRKGPDADAAPLVVRDVQTEAHAREIVRRYFTVRESAVFLQAKGEDLGALVYEGVASLQEVGDVFVSSAFGRLKSKARPRIRVGLSVHSRLLELDMSLEGASDDELAGLLESYSLRHKYHQLRDGAIVRVSDANVAEVGRMADELGISTQDLDRRVTVPAYRALLIDELVDVDEGDGSFEEYVSRVRSPDLDATQVPRALEGVLRPYQREGFRWLSGLAQMGLGGILADEMGLGKSAQLIAFLLAHRDEMRRVGPTLVVCPSSLVYNWKAEFAKFAPELALRVVAGTPVERQEVRDDKRADVFVTSYDLLRRDVEAYEGRRLWCVALDEAQYIKNPTTQAAQAVKRLEAVNHVALTGTPVENRLSELWSIFDFLMPGLLGSYGRFRDRFERPIVEDGDAKATERLRDALRPFILRRTKHDVAADLPDKIEQVVRTHMGGEQRMLYQAQLQEVRERLDSYDDKSGKGRFQILALLTRLRQICCDPRLLYEGYDAPSCKTETILTLVERVADAGEKMLLFSQFTSYLDVISAELDKRGIAYYVIKGETPSVRRLDLVNKFNANKVPVFLISLKAGGTGLNLTGATVVVHADPWWNVAAQNQATDRAHRIGQTREVTVYKVIVGKTVEERILELQRTKAELADAVVQGDVSSTSLSSLTREDLLDLLG